ncbi:hypothetical protein [Paenibacillus polysaccharolyticus]|uniref:hypothetical protein n=1 Tax=Paenibacillus polysaccharolyticus TaxID=582692 RepID=UPI0030082856
MAEWINSVWDSGVPMTLFTGVAVPIFAVLLSVRVTLKKAKEKELEDERNQRIKLLHMLRHELKTVITHYNAKNKYYTKESLTGKLIVNSPLFNVKEHKAMLNGLWEYLRGYESLNTAIDSIPMQFAPIQTAILDSSTEPSGLHDFKKFKELSDEFVNKEIVSIIDESVQYIITAAKPLLEEVEKQIRLEKRNHQRRFFRKIFAVFIFKKEVKDMIVINFLDGTDITITKDTVLNGFNNFSDDPEKEFYLKKVYSDSINGSETKEASRLSTDDRKVGIMGFILSVDCFSIGEEGNTLYRSSAVKSVENSNFSFG